jgi:hypothetical protein
MTDLLQPQEADLLLEVMRARLALVHTSIPAVVTDYDHTAQKATVRLAIRLRREDPATGALEFYEPPLIPNVPVMFLSGSGYAFTFPLAAGDPVTVFFLERSTDGWRDTGEPGQEPWDTRRFDLTDAVAIPAGRSFAAGKATGPIGSSGIDSHAAVIEAAMLLLGSSGATDFVALAAKVLSELQAIQTWANTHVHPGVIIGPASTGVAAPPMLNPGSVAATKVKAE